MSDMSQRRCGPCNQDDHARCMHVKCQCECQDRADPVAFLCARLDEWAAGAKGILEDPDYKAEWHEQSSGVLYVGPGSEAHPMDGLQPMGDSRLTRFIAEHDPASVLRAVAAMRAILDEHAPCYPVTYPEPSGQPTCGVCHAGGWDWEPEGWPCPTVRHLATIWPDSGTPRQP